MAELRSAAIRGETSVRLDDLVVRVSMRTDVPREGDAVFVYYDFTDRYSLYVTQTLGMLFSFVGLTIILVVFSYMMSGVLLGSRARRARPPERPRCQREPRTENADNDNQRQPRRHQEQPGRRG